VAIRIVILHKPIMPFADNPVRIVIDDDAPDGAPPHHSFFAQVKRLYA
jgi:hypothetical protein